MFNITSIVIIVGQGADKLYLHTDLHPSIWPYDSNAELKLDVAAGNGEEYVKINFPGINYEIIER